MAKWTMEDVAARFSEAAETGRRLPRVRVQGYFNVWPVFAREVWESYSDEDPVYRAQPPNPHACQAIRVEGHLSSLWL
jgi:hypothetical protein